MSRIYDALKKAEQENKQKLTSAPLSSEAAQAAPSASLRASGAEPAPASTPSFSTPVSAPPAIAPLASPPTAEKPTTSCTAAAAAKAEPRKPIQIFSPAGELRGAEELRRLRTKLQHARERSPFRTVLITSALPGEGKTFISMNLAHALTMQHNTRVLVIDADLRKPQLHAQFGVDNGSGLTDYLERRCEWESIIRTTAVPNLHIITGGLPSNNVAELAGNARFAELITGAAERFEWVLIDTSPVIPVTDAAVLARVCDATLLVVAAEQTSGDVAQAALQELKEANIIGVVLNRATRTSAHYHNYYYYETYARGGAPKAQAAAAGR